ncbi:hypothetical protein Sste5346_002906 [Sporothrix stenoceras]|uniref:DUF7053 domain-containing protein n=1 Tax=Sporothrix stenoceras TaxID=5173 RepID=A0ABR3ZH39_9PEZI
MPFLTFNLSYPLPAECQPQRVLDALHRYEPLITPNPYLVSFRRRPVDLTEIVDDPFFREDGQALAAFEVVDRIVLVPGVASKQVVIPCVMQRFAGGVRCRSLAAGGVRVWSTWRVLPAGQVVADNSSSSKRSSVRTSRDEGRRSRSNSPAQTPVTAAATLAQAPTPPATPPTTNGNNPAGAGAGAIVFPESGEGYEIVEEARVECGSLVKPFVGRSFREGHIEILRQVVKGVLDENERAKMSYVYM